MNNLDGLNSLLKAKSKTIVEKCLNLTYLTRHITSGKDSCIENFQSILEINSEEADLLFISLLNCISISLKYGNIEDFSAYLEKYGPSVNVKLKQLIIQIIGNQLDSWKEAAAINRISIPKLVDFNWTINLKKSSNEVLKMNEPCALVSLTIEKEVTNINEIPDNDLTEFELSREALQTVLEGFAKIKDQLAKMK